MEGFLTSMLRGVVATLSSPIVQEFKLLWGMEKERQKLESNLSAIGAVLHDAETHQVKEMAVRDWLQKLKDAAYDAEDLVDEFMVEALRRKVESGDGMQKKVCNFFSPLNPLAFRCKMARKMQELRERFDVIAKEKDSFHFKGGVVESQPSISISTRETHSYVIESNVYGRDNEKMEIIRSLINTGNEEVVSVIPIVGMGGLGKTAITQLVYNDQSVVAHFDLRMWVYVPEDFDVARLVKEILQSAIAGKSDPLSMDLLQSRLRKKLSGKKYLLVLDDVWNEVHEKWDKLKTLLKCGAQGSKIMVTTRSNTVASIMGTLPAHQLVTLPENESWSFFEKLSYPDPKLVSIGKEIVGKCGGLPLAIKTLGALLSYKRSESEWSSIRDSEFWELQENDGEILPALRLSYHHLTPQLKQCFAYCAAIPKGKEFEKDKLIKQWVAQGFIQSSEENELLEEIGDRFYNDLLSRSLFQVADKSLDDLPKDFLRPSHEDDNGSVTKLKMHDLIHDLARFVAGTACFVVEASKKAIPGRKPHHLSLCDSKWAIESKNLKALEECKKLRSLFLYKFVDVNVCLSFRRLRVLNLCGTSISYLPNSVGKLRYLRYLDVSDTLIAELPETICNLHSLQTLIINRTLIEKLPKDMTRMISLRHIEFDGGQVAHSSNGIGLLTSLQTLPRFIVGEECGAGIEELRCLNHLREELHISGLQNIRNDVCAREANLKEKRRLSSLVLTWCDVRKIADTGVNPESVIENLEPHPNLKKLSVENYMGLVFPSWIRKLANLVKISLGNCKRCERLPPIGLLPCLESLSITMMDAVKYISDFDEACKHDELFPSLKKLELIGLTNLEGWWPRKAEDVEPREERDERVLLRNLRNLKISNCPKFIQFPKLFATALAKLDMCSSGCDRLEMQTSHSLKKVDLCGMPNLVEFSLQEANGEQHDEMRERNDEQVIFHGLEELRVDKCPRLVCLPRLLPSLWSLKIEDSNEMLPGFVANYTSLASLSITGLSQTMHLPEELGRNNARLSDLEIDNCPKLISIANQLKNLSALASLSIVNCPGLQSLGPLRSQRMEDSYEMQTSIPGDGIDLPSLRSLFLASCQNLESLQCDGLQKLTYFGSLECPKLWSSFPEWGSNLTSLFRAGIGSIETLPESLENFKSLGILSISRVNMRSLPESIGNLTSLFQLHILDFPILTTLPESIGNLKKLDFLYIDDCPALTFLPNSIGNFTSLTILRIRSCPLIGSLPESMGNLIYLEELMISGLSGIQSLPESVGKLSSLVTLLIEELPLLTTLPESIGNLKSLGDLRVLHCLAMKSLPESLGNLSSLCYLQIDNCPEILALPIELQRLTNLRIVNITRCPVLKRTLCNNEKKMKKTKMKKAGKDWQKVAHIQVLIDGLDLAACYREEEHNCDKNVDSL